MKPTVVTCHVFRHWVVVLVVVAVLPNDLLTPPGVAMALVQKTFLMPSPMPFKNTLCGVTKLSGVWRRFVFLVSMVPLLPVCTLITRTSTLMSTCSGCFANALLVPTRMWLLTAGSVLETCFWTKRTPHPRRVLWHTLLHLGLNTWTLTQKPKMLVLGNNRPTLTVRPMFAT